MREYSSLLEMVQTQMSAVALLRTKPTTQLLILRRWLDKVIVNRNDLRTRARHLYLLVDNELENRIYPDRFKTKTDPSKETTRILDKNCA